MVYAQDLIALMQHLICPDPTLEGRQVLASQHPAARACVEASALRCPEVAHRGEASLLQICQSAD
jgi:hypothetical protein